MTNTTPRSSLGILNGNAIKLLAALFMLIDHIGVLLLPDWQILRIIGRLSFPLYAYMIAEGCRYTRNKLRYFLSVFLLGALCQGVYLVYGGEQKLNVLLTFSISILLVYALQAFKKQLSDPKATRGGRFAASTLLAASLVAVLLLNMAIDVTYRFFGCVLPLFASLFMPVSATPTEAEHQLDRTPLHVLCLGVGSLALSLDYGGIQFFCLAALPLLLLYSGKRGKRKMKYFFYVFYPTHLVLLEAIAYLLRTL